LEQHTARADTKRWILLIAILWLAFALRFFALGAQELRGDEAASWARITQEPGPIELFQRLVSEGQPHPPLHYWLLQAWARGWLSGIPCRLSPLLNVWWWRQFIIVALKLRLGVVPTLLALVDGGSSVSGLAGADAEMSN
jgi:hypothetical protein